MGSEKFLRLYSYKEIYFFLVVRVCGGWGGGWWSRGWSDSGMVGWMVCGGIVVFW